MSVFIDSCVFIAFKNKDDENHGKAVRLVSDIEKKEFGAVFTSDQAFSECVTFLKGRLKDFKGAREIGEMILASETRILKTTEQTFEKAWDIFKKYEDLSFADSVAIVLVQENNLNYIATFDREFKRVKGIQVLDES